MLETLRLYADLLRDVAEALSDPESSPAGLELANTDGFVESMNDHIRWYVGILESCKRVTMQQVTQVWSLSSFEVSSQLLKNDLNQISSVSLLMTSLTALAN